MESFPWRIRMAFPQECHLRQNRVTQSASWFLGIILSMRASTSLGGGGGKKASKGRDKSRAIWTFFAWPKNPVPLRGRLKLVSHRKSNERAALQRRLLPRPLGTKTQEGPMAQNTLSGILDHTLCDGPIRTADMMDHCSGPYYCSHGTHNTWPTSINRL